MIDLPKFMNKNIILLDKHNFGEEVKGDHKTQFEIFKLHWISKNL